MGRVTGVDAFRYAPLLRMWYATCGRDSFPSVEKKGAHYTENPRENTFYLIGKSRKLPLISPVKDYNRARNKIVAGRELGNEQAAMAGTEIPGGLQPNFRYGSSAVSTPAANGSFNSLPSPWNCRIIGEVILNSRLRRERARRTASWSIDLFVRQWVCAP